MGGKGGGSSPVEQDDTVSSKQTLKILLALGEGEIEAIEQVYLNKTPISSYQNCSYQTRLGTPSQTVITGFGEVANEAVGFSQIQITNATQFIRDVDYTVTSVRLTFTTPVVRTIKANGDIVGGTIQLDVQTKPLPGGVFSLNKSTTKNIKVSNSYSWSVRIDRPAGATPGNNWTVKVIRVSPDDVDAKHNSTSYISGFTELKHPIPQLTYNNTVLVGLTLGDANQFGGNVPDIAIKLKGWKINLPINYNPTTLVYTGNWNGAFNTTLQYTNNPVWLLLHILRKRMLISDTRLDMGAFYLAAQYCDVLVSDGSGGSEPRYTINNQFAVREGVARFLNYFLTIFNGSFTTNQFGQISLLYDRANQPTSHIVNNTNVIAGGFSYSSNDLENRYSQVNVTYNEPTSFYDTETTTHDDTTLLTRYGLQTSDVVLAGCTSEAQALRKARWQTYTNAYQTQLISFAKGIEGSTFFVGELVSISDNQNSGYDINGVITSSSWSANLQTLTLDHPINLATTTYTIQYLDNTGSVVTNIVQQSNGTFTTLTFSTATQKPATTQSPFILQSSTVKPIMAKVVSVKKNDNIYQITALQHDENKYAYIDGTITKVPRPSQFINTQILNIDAPTGVTVTEVHAATSTTAISSLNVKWSWTMVGAKYKPTFNILYRRDNNNFTQVSNIEATSYDIANPLPGQYEIYVVAVNPISQIKSVPSTQFIYAFRVISAGSTLLAPLTAWVEGTNGTTFNSQDLNLVINYNTNNDNVTDRLKDYVVEVWDVPGTTKYLTETVQADVNKNARWSLPFYKNLDLFTTPKRSFQVKVFSRDLIGDLSIPLSQVFNNPTPSAPSFTIAPATGQVYVDIARSNAPDIAGYEIHGSATSGFTPTPGTLLYSGVNNNTIVPAPSGNVIYIRVGAFDNFDKASITYATQQNTTALSTSAIEWTISDGIKLAGNDPVTNTMSWTAGNIIKNNGGVTTIYPIVAGSVAWTTGTIYLYFSGTGTALTTTTVLATAVSGWLIATYKGGKLVQSDNGNVFIDGSSIYAGTVGANQVVASGLITNAAQINTAIINSTHIADASITNAKIADVISSNSFVAGSAGWSIGQTSNIAEFNGNCVFRGVLNVKSAASGARMELTNSTMRIYDAAGVLRVKIGNLA